MTLEATLMWPVHQWNLPLNTCSAHLTCLMLKLDTDMIMVGLLQISSGRTQREKMAFCLGDRASFPVLSLVRLKKKVKTIHPCLFQNPWKTNGAHHLLPVVGSHLTVSMNVTQNCERCPLEGEINNRGKLTRKGQERQTAPSGPHSWRARRLCHWL